MRRSTLKTETCSNSEVVKAVTSDRTQVSCQVFGATDIVTDRLTNIQMVSVSEPNLVLFVRTVVVSLQLKEVV